MHADLRDPVTAAIGRITARRTSAHDDHLEALPDDPAGVVGYVCSHTRGVPRPVVAADVADALQIIRALRAVLDRREYALIQAGRRAGLSWGDLARALGLRSRQAAEQRALRLEIGTGGGEGRSEVTARARRRGEETEPGWIAGHRREIEAVACHLAGRQFQTEDAQDAVEALAEAVAEPESTPRQLLAWISVVVRALAASGEDPPDAGRVLAQARQLVDGWQLIRSP